MYMQDSVFGESLLYLDKKLIMISVILDLLQLMVNLLHKHGIFEILSQLLYYHVSAI